MFERFLLVGDNPIYGPPVLAPFVTYFTYFIAVSILTVVSILLLIKVKKNMRWFSRQVLTLLLTILTAFMVIVLFALVIAPPIIPYVFNCTPGINGPPSCQGFTNMGILSQPTWVYYLGIGGPSGLLAVLAVRRVLRSRKAKQSGAKIVKSASDLIEHSRQELT